MSTLCSQNTTGIWTCGLTGANGYAAQAGWNPGGNTAYAAQSRCINYLDLVGALHGNFERSNRCDGAEPILLQNQERKDTKCKLLLREATPFPELRWGRPAPQGPIAISVRRTTFTGTVTLN